MRHQNNVRKLGRTHPHRKSMLANLAVALFRHERIVTTKAKGKELKRLSERLITRAKRNIELPESETSKKLHNKREVMRVINDRDVVKKLFEEIAPRFKDRKGGYTRLILLGKRRGDAADMSIVELVERSPVRDTASKKIKKDKTEKEPAAENKEVKEKRGIFQRFMKRKEV